MTDTRHERIRDIQVVYRAASTWRGGDQAVIADAARRLYPLPATVVTEIVASLTRSGVLLEGGCDAAAVDRRGRISVNGSADRSYRRLSASASIRSRRMLSA
jgi:hypothetical protein